MAETSANKKNYRFLISLSNGFNGGVVVHEYGINAALNSIFPAQSVRLVYHGKSSFVHTFKIKLNGWFIIVKVVLNHVVIWFCLERWIF